MFSVWQSNKTEQLVRALAEDILHINPFDTPLIVVSNRRLATYLKYEIASLNGVCINLRFESIHYLINLLDKRRHPAARAISAKTNLQLALLNAFYSNDTSSEPFDKLRSFIHSDLPSDVLSLRRFQLADQLSAIFNDYLLSRPDWLALWKNNNSVFSPDEGHTTEGWQSALWRQFLADCEPDIHTLTNDFNTNQRSIPDLPHKIYLFGFSFLEIELLKLLNSLSFSTDVLVFALNPCMEFWEDVYDTNTEHVLGEWDEELGDDDPSDLWSEKELPILRLWGGTGRKFIRILNQLTNFNFHDLFSPPSESPTSLLEHLQQDILTRANLLDRHSQPIEFVDDRSIHIFECPSVDRELEHIANTIWQLRHESADTDTPLSFTDFTVLIPTEVFDQYQSALQSVFEQTHHIPYNVSDISASQHQQLLEALRLLVELPFTALKNDDLLRILSHPNVVAKFPEIDPESIKKWVRDLNVVEGADLSDLSDTFLELDLYNWHQALRRLTLGAFFMQSETPQIWTSPDNFEYIPYLLPSNQMEQVALFIELASKLIDYRRIANTTERTLDQWIQLLRQLTDDLLAPTENSDDNYQLQRILGRLGLLAEQSALSQPQPVPYRIAAELVKQQCEELDMNIGHYLLDGVTIAKLTPMRPIPSAVTFVAGLSYDNFPRSDYRSSLNLRWAKPRPNDPPTLRDIDEYLFLETILCTRRNLLLSYVSVASKDGSEQPPSSVISELLALLKQNYVPANAGENPASLYTVVPKQRWANPLIAQKIDLPVSEDPLPVQLDLAPWEMDLPDNTPPPQPTEKYDNSVAPSLQPQAILEHNAEALYYSFSQQFPHIDLRELSWKQLKPYMLPEHAQFIENTLHLPSLRDIEKSQSTETIALKRLKMEHPDYSLTIRDLAEFLKSPLQGAARYLYRMRKSTSRLQLNDTYLTASLRRERLREVLVETFFETLRETNLTPKNLRARLDEKTHLLELQGVSPTGIFRQAENDRLELLFSQWLNWLKQREVELADPFFSVSFGTPKTPYLVSALATPLELKTSIGGENLTLKLSATTLPCNRKNTILALHQHTIIPKNPNGQPMTGYDHPVEVLEAFLTLLLLSTVRNDAPDLIPTATSENYSICICGAGNFNYFNQFKYVAADDAKSYLTTLATDLIMSLTSESPPERFPAESILGYSRSLDKTLADYRNYSEKVEQLDRYRSNPAKRPYSSLIGPIDNAASYPIATNFKDLYERRFSLFFRHLQG